MGSYRNRLPDVIRRQHKSTSSPRERFVEATYSSSNAERRQMMAALGTYDTEPYRDDRNLCRRDRATTDRLDAWPRAPPLRPRPTILGATSATAGSQKWPSRASIQPCGTTSESEMPRNPLCWRPIRCCGPQPPPADRMADDDDLAARSRNPQAESVRPSRRPPRLPACRATTSPADRLRMRCHALE